jgi:hypothetical protein
MKKSLALIVWCVDYMLRCTYRSSTLEDYHRLGKSEVEDWGQVGGHICCACYLLHPSLLGPPWYGSMVKVLNWFIALSAAEAVLMKSIVQSTVDAQFACTEGLQAARCSWHKGNYCLCVWRMGQLAWQRTTPALQAAQKEKSIPSCNAKIDAFGFNLYIRGADFSKKFKIWKSACCWIRSEKEF